LDVKKREANVKKGEKALEDKVSWHFCERYTS